MRITTTTRAAVIAAGAIVLGTTGCSPKTSEHVDSSAHVAQRKAAAVVLTRAADPRYLNGGNFPVSQLGSSDIPGLKKGQKVVLEVACAGSGTVKAALTSGGRTVKRAYDCQGSPEEQHSDDLEFTLPGTDLTVSFTASTGATGGLAYVVRKPGLSQEEKDEQAAQSVLTPTTDARFLEGGSGGLDDTPGFDDNSLAKGETVDIQVACVGTGKLTLHVASSPSAKPVLSKTFACRTDVAAEQSTLFTTPTKDVYLSFEPSKGAKGALAYSVVKVKG